MYARKAYDGQRKKQGRSQFRRVNLRSRGVLCHFILLLLEPAFLVEGDIGVATVEDSLVATRRLADVSEGLDDAKTKFLSLLRLVYRDVLDVSHGAKSAEELALNEKGADSNDGVGVDVEDDDGKVRVRCGAHCIELSHPSTFPRVCDDCKDGENGEVTAGMVG